MHSNRADQFDLNSLPRKGGECGSIISKPSTEGRESELSTVKCCFTRISVRKTKEEDRSQGGKRGMAMKNGIENS